MRVTDEKLVILKLKISIVPYFLFLEQIFSLFLFGKNDFFDGTNDKQNGGLEVSPAKIINLVFYIFFLS